MYFDDFKKHKKAKLNKDLFWEYDTEKMDFKKHIEIVVQRVIERGDMEDFYALFNMFKKKDIAEAIKKIPNMSAGDIEFVSHVFEIPKVELEAWHHMINYPEWWPHFKGINRS